MPVADGVGNGVHIHFSLRDASGEPATYDADGPLGLSQAAAQFAAGVLAHLPAIAAITAPSPVSYLRLTPNRWAPTAIDLVKQDRGAALRVCPVFAASRKKDIAKAFNLEFRVCDAAASPYLALGALLFAGADGIARQLALPQAGAPAKPLPHSLGEALDDMEKSEAVASGSGRCSARPISATSARSSPMWRGSMRRSSAPATPKSIELRRRAAASPAVDSMRQ